MALTFPLSLAAFIDLVSLERADLYLEHQQEMSGTGGGEILTASLAPSRFTAKCQTVQMPHREADGLMALLDSLAQSQATFLLGPVARMAPAGDLDGSAFGVATPTVDTVTDSYHVSFAGFPAGYALARGDWTSIAYGSGKYWLGRFAEAVTADGSGDVASVRVNPALPAAVANGDDVTVIDPVAKFKLVPGTAYPSVTSPLWQTIAFEAVQTYA